MDRRRFLSHGAALAALAALVREVDDFVRGPAIQDPPLRQVSRHVWMIHSPDGFPTPENQGMMCNLTFVDSGTSVQIAEMAIRQFRQPVVAGF